MLHPFEKGLCRKTASIFELAGKKGLPVLLFTDLWFSSDCAKRLYNYDFYDIAQSPLYHFHNIMAEMDELAKYENTENGFAELLYWSGYTLAYWQFWRNISWQKIKEKYDWKKFLSDYDCLHTMAVEKAIELAETEHRRDLLAEMQISALRRKRENSSGPRRPAMNRWIHDLIFVIGVTCTSTAFFIICYNIPVCRFVV